MKVALIGATGYVGSRILSELLQRRHRVTALTRHPAVRNARSIGTIAALELGDAEGSYLSQLGPKLLAFFRDRNLLLRPLGNTIYIMPPYCIGDDDLDAIYAAIAEACDWPELR